MNHIFSQYALFIFFAATILYLELIYRLSIFKSFTAIISSQRYSRFPPLLFSFLRLFLLQGQKQDYFLDYHSRLNSCIWRATYLFLHF